MNTGSTPNHPGASATLPVVAPLPGLACLELKGPDAKSFLHRLSTNAVETLTPGESSLNVLVNAKGRMVALLHQLVLADDRVLIVGGRDQNAALVAWFEQYHFVEEVEFIDRTHEVSLSLVLGASEHEGWAWRSFDYLGEGQTKRPAWIVNNFPADADQIIDASTLETWRIASGIPGYPQEVNEAYNPLELGLGEAIHWAKGCYIGQEVISRLDTYSKLNKKMRRLGTEPSAFASLQAGATVIFQEKPVGTLTSVAPHFRAGSPNALAVLKLTAEGNEASSLDVQTLDGTINVTLLI